MLVIKSKDGIGLYTEFVDKETGENLANKLAIEFGATITLDHIVSANIKLSMIEVDIEVGRVNWLMPNPIRNKELMSISKVIFKNGDEIDFKENGGIEMKSN